MKGMLVSIITVSYNAVNTIEMTIQNVVNQSYPYIEYIIIDGGSTDGTIDIIKKYNDRISYWISESDAGIYDAMNKGLAHAHGDIVGIINSDDWYVEDTIKNIVSMFERDSAIKLIHGNIVKVDQHGGELGRFKPSQETNNIWHDIVVYHPTCFLKKSLYDLYGGFSTQYVIAGDYEFFLRLYHSGVTFHYLDKPIACFRSGGLSDLAYKAGMKEVCLISQSFGYSKWKAEFWYCYKVFRHWSGMFLMKHNLSVIVKLYRQFCHRV